MENIFIDWKTTSFLADTADILIRRFLQGRDLNMRGLLLVLPNGRARSRLELILVQKVEDLIRQKIIASDWYPPELITLAHFPEKLYPIKSPAAKTMSQIFAWSKVLRKMAADHPERLSALLPNGLPKDDFSLLSISKKIADIHCELAAENSGFDKVVDLITVPEEKNRWNTLLELQNNYLALLDQLKQWDIQTARIFALKFHECRTDKEIYVIGASDLNKVQKEMLHAIKDHVHIMICAPESERNGFDAFGTLVPDYWNNKVIPISDEQIIQTDKPEDQADQIMDYLAAFLDKCPGHIADACSVCVPDSEILPSLIQKMESKNIPYHVSAGTPLFRNRVYSLIALIAKYQKNFRFSDLADLVRHPDMERYLIRKLNEAGDEISYANWITDFDHLQNYLILDRVDPKWSDTYIPKNIDTEKIKKVIALIDDLLIPFRQNEEKGIHSEQRNISGIQSDSEDSDEMEKIDSILKKIPQIRWRCFEKSQTLKQWCPDLSQLICTLYPDSDDPDSNDPDPLSAEQINAGIVQINDCLSRFAEIPDALQISVSASFAFNLLIKELGTLTITSRNPDNAVPLVGWLELLLDDRPYLIISGMNEGIIPTAISDDPFLPNSLRQQLDLPDNRRRFARDVWAMSALHASHPLLKIVFGRHSLEGDPHQPGRLLFMCDTKTIVDRVCRFFGDQKEIKADKISNRISGNSSEFAPPVLHPKGDPPKEYKVTAFKDFLSSPYIYFLKHYYKLDAISDGSSELDPLAFGNIVHDVLSSFASRREMREETDPDRLLAHLSALLDSGLKKRFSEYTSPIVPIQIELIRRRLAAFAQWQTQWLGFGNRIMYAEAYSKDPVLLNVDGDPVVLRGRIDRIDFNERTGDWHIFDYKTFDAVNKSDHKVDKDHRKRIGIRRSPIQVLCENYFPGVSLNQSGQANYEWTNLQLPLYRHIFAKILEQDHLSCPDESRIKLGYIILPKSEETFVDLGEWSSDDLKQADEYAYYVIRMIRKMWNQKEGIPFDASTHPSSPGNFYKEFTFVN
ncbi:MAG: PD-(D/E)XK nuclease family protein [Planctomycetia bacterium]|nr:PD-(D/E)XK nuclease family protein [Planctomycetia bacterium]